MSPPALPPRVRFCSYCGSPFGNPDGCRPERCAALGVANEHDTAGDVADERDKPIGRAEIGAVVGEALDLAGGLANVARDALRGLARLNHAAGGEARKGPIER